MDAVPHTVDAPSCTGEERITVSPNPRRPVPPLPHTHRVPSVLSAPFALPMPATARQVPNVPTCTGEERITISPTPKYPPVFPPHVHSVPSIRIAAEIVPPAPTGPHVPSPPTCTGEERNTSCLKPKPSWPCVFFPQLQSVPSDLTATACRLPLDTAAHVASVPTCTGEER